MLACNTLRTLQWPQTGSSKHLTCVAVQVARLHKQVHKFGRDLADNAIVPKLRESVSSWQELLPVVQCLRNPDMKERHWDKVAELLGQVVDKTDETSLQKLMQLRVGWSKPCAAMMPQILCRFVSLWS